MPTLETLNSGRDVTLLPTTSQGDGAAHEKAKGTQTYDVEDSESEPEPCKEAPEGVTKTTSLMTAYLEHVFSKRLDAMQSMVERLPGRMLTVALPKELCEATICKRFSSTLIGPAWQCRDLEKTSDGLYEILRHRVEPLQGYIARFNQEKVAIPECNISTAISAFKRGFLPDGDLYKELTKYQCNTIKDVLSRAWAQVKWEEDVASRAKAQQILRRSGRTEMSETRDPFQDQQRIPGTEAGADTRTGRSKRQKGWQCPRRQTSLTPLSQRRSWSMF
ncbi:hypothetical protein DY000_02048776 [Brassica cretica]|uniref:Retrotransposon gag domain-containing protein n=1 Tax=Brassica cretica TaxID=69181 RepID=A0ABQ7ER50_BRACR|nr:hypothetical protein DY000_02048776 [Brassica cretica]